jgi:hypothetical protein
MKKLLALLLLFTGVGFAQDDDVPYFQGPYFERFYSPLGYSEVAGLESTLAIREVVGLLGEVESSTERPAFTFVSRQAVTTAFHDVIERMYSPLYGGDTSAFRGWLETYYTQETLADEMTLYFTGSSYDEALAGSDDQLDTKDFSDVLTMFLVMSYLVANHLDSTPAAHDLAVREQVRAALASSPRFAALSDAEKQEGVLLLLFFTSYNVGDYNRALDSSNCAANDVTPGPSEATFYCGKYTEVDLVSTFTEGVAQTFGFRVRDVVMTENGFESKSTLSSEQNSFNKFMEDTATFPKFIGCVVSFVVSPSFCLD